MQAFFSILAQPRSAFRLHIAVRPPPVAALSLRLSPRLDLKPARLSLAVYHCRPATRRGTVRHSSTDETTNAARPPVRHETMLNRVEMRVVHVSRNIPNARFAEAGHH